MASSSNASSSWEKPNSRKDVKGFIHDVSAVDDRSGSRFFSFKLQERDECRRVVCFQTEKREDIQQKAEMKSPVRILQLSPQKRRFRPDVLEYKLEKFSKVEVKPNMSFPWKDQSTPKVTVKTIIDEYGEGDVVSVECKVLHKLETQEVYSKTHGKDLNKCDIIIADATGTIRMTIWEALIEQVEASKSYLFKDVKVNCFSGKALNSNTTSRINALPTDVNIFSSVEEEGNRMANVGQDVRETISGKILSVEVS